MKDLKNLEVLKKHSLHWVTLRDANYISNLPEVDVNELQKVYHDEVDANYHVNKWCNSCVAEMINILYRSTDFDALVAPKKEVSVKAKK
jgi:hypothetical protein